MQTSIGSSSQSSRMKTIPIYGSWTHTMLHRLSTILIARYRSETGKMVFCDHVYVGIRCNQNSQTSRLQEVRFLRNSAYTCPAQTLPPRGSSWMLIALFTICRFSPANPICPGLFESTLAWRSFCRVSIQVLVRTHAIRFHLVSLNLVTCEQIKL